MANVCTARPSWRKWPMRGMTTLSRRPGSTRACVAVTRARPGTAVETTAATAPSPHSTAGGAVVVVDGPRDRLGHDDQHEGRQRLRAHEIESRCSWAKKLVQAELTSNAGHVELERARDVAGLGGRRRVARRRPGDHHADVGCAIRRRARCAISPRGGRSRRCCRAPPRRRRAGRGCASCGCSRAAARCAASGCRRARGSTASLVPMSSSSRNALVISFSGWKWPRPCRYSITRALPRRARRRRRG